MNESSRYPIGTPCVPWQNTEKQAWRNHQAIKRSYLDLVVAPLNELGSEFTLIEYGHLDYQEAQYPLLALKSGQWHDDKPWVLVTGGVHGYETSGILGAIEFARSHAKRYEDRFNFLIAPCVSPWGFETINRWNPDAIDPNRSFYPDSPAAESAALMALVAEIGSSPVIHIDLHETTDTDNSEFRPALAAREGTINTNWNIPDGFYLVADSLKPAPEFQRAINDRVAKVTHIAPDSDGKLIGEPITDKGVIDYQAKKLGLCMGMTEAPYVTTTEVYPDSPNTSPEECIAAQVAAVTGALDYVSGLA